MANRRITERRAGAGKVGGEAAALIAGSRVGIVDGVHVDFRHPELDPAEWEAAPHWYVWGLPPQNIGVIFPSEAALGVDELTRIKSPEVSELPVFIAKPGDSLSITHVVPEIRDARFDHPHDRQTRLAYLKLESDGVQHALPSPLQFVGTTRIRDGATRLVFDNTVERICKLTSVHDIQAASIRLPERWDASLESRAIAAAVRAHSAVFQLLDETGEESFHAARIRTLANNAVLMGFLLAKSEARRAEASAAKSAENALKGAAKVTRLDWRKKAEEIWAMDPSLKVHAVAVRIAEGTEDDVRSISRAIKKLKPQVG